jgi:group I intron endonuclease
MAVIYRITNMANGKFYIGSAESFARREWQHKYDLKRNTHKNPHLQASWNKHGEEMFVFEIVEEIPEGQEQLVWEDKWLRECVGKPDCYNVNTLATAPRLGLTLSEESKAKISAKVNQAVAEGRGGAFIPSDETRQKMSEALKGNQNALGYKRSEEEREAIRQRTLGNQNFLGKKHTEEAKTKLRRPIFAILPDGTRRDFAGTALAGEELGVVYPMLVRAMKAQKPIAKGRLAGWLFCYADAPVELPAPVKIPEEFKHLPRTRQQAKDEGAKEYFTGLPCAHGHISPRLTKGSCIACRKAGLA